MPPVSSEGIFSRPLTAGTVEETIPHLTTPPTRNLQEKWLVVSESHNPFIFVMSFLITIIKYIKSVKGKRNAVEEGVSTIKDKQAFCFRARKGRRESG